MQVSARKRPAERSRDGLITVLKGHQIVFQRGQCCEVVRRQDLALHDREVDDLTTLLDGNDEAALIRAAALELDGKLAAAEANFFQPVLAEGDLKSFRAPVKLYSQLALLAGDVMSVDFPPTDAQLEVFEELKQELAAAQRQLAEVLDRDLAALNRTLAAKSLPTITAQTP